MLECAASWMSEALVPQIEGGCGGDHGFGRGGCQGIQVASAVTSENLRPSGKVLDRETKRIKFNRNVVILGKRMDRN